MLAAKGWDRLGSLEKSKVKALTQEEKESNRTLQELREERGLTVPFLKSQWEEQKRLQLSVKACASLPSSNVTGTL